jgi:hypothetical protein
MYNNVLIEQNNFFHLVIANQVSKDFSILLGNGNGTLFVTPAVDFGAGVSPHSVAVGDFN